ncbi:hypothetical protein ACVPOR_16320 [Staphylococcus aureus]
MRFPSWKRAHPNRMLMHNGRLEVPTRLKVM